MICLLPDKGVQAGVAGPADGKAGAVPKNRGMAVLCIQFQFCQTIHIENVGAVDANKTGAIERRFPRLQEFAV